MKVLKYLILFSLVFVFFSCSVLNLTYDYTFINNSEYNVSISPNGQDWIGFILGAGQTRTLTINEKTIYLFYDDASGLYIDYVECDTTTPYKIIFYNKTFLKINNESSSDLYSVSWNGINFGKNSIWDNDLVEYVDGLPSDYGTDIQNVEPGVDYIEFTYTYGGILYRATNQIKLNDHDQIEFVFSDTTPVEKK